MNKTHLLAILVALLIVSCSTTQTNQATFSDNDEKEIVAAMHKSAADWNRTDLNAFMSIYADSSTFMMQKGPVGVNEAKQNYAIRYFGQNAKPQDLRFSELVVRPLGNDYALLTGKFTLLGNDKPEATGRYSLVFVRTTKGWKILHDHSS